MERSGQEPVDELVRAFPHLERDLVESILLSLDGNVTMEILRESLGLAVGKAMGTIKDGDHIAVGSPIWIVGSKPVRVIGPLGELLGEFAVVFVPPSFGSYALDAITIVATTPVYDYVVAIDNFNDVLIWALDDEKAPFSADLESAILELIALTEDAIPTAFSAMSSMAAAVGGPTASAGYAEMERSLREDLASALGGSTSGLCKAHASLLQTAQAGRLLGLPAALRDATAQMERCKIGEGKKVLLALEEAEKAGRSYGEWVRSNPYVMQMMGENRLRTLDWVCSQLRQVIDGRKWDLLWSIAPQLQMEGIASSGQFPPPLIPAASYCPSLPEWSLLNNNLRDADIAVERWTETLCGGAILVGSAMRQWRMSLCDAQRNATVLRSLLQCGLGYAQSADGSLCGLNGPLRAYVRIPMDSQTPVKHSRLLGRRKECARQLRRAAEKNIHISLRCNSVKLSESVGFLRAHHSDANWVDEHVERSWEELVKQKRMCVIELWEGDRMAACDFCHMIGESVYVATRYFNKECSHLSPGFMLALLEMKLLQKHGFRIWDLGQTDSNPVMAYKDVVAHVLPRSTFLQHFRMINRDAPLTIPDGVLIESVQIDDFLPVEK